MSKKIMMLLLLLTMLIPNMALAKFSDTINEKYFSSSKERISEIRCLYSLNEQKTTGADSRLKKIERIIITLDKNANDFEINALVDGKGVIGHFDDNKKLALSLGTGYPEIIVEKGISEKILSSIKSTGKCFSAISLNNSSGSDSTTKNYSFDINPSSNAQGYFSFSSNNGYSYVKFIASQNFTCDYKLDESRSSFKGLAVIGFSRSGADVTMHVYDTLDKYNAKQGGGFTVSDEASYKQYLDIAKLYLRKGTIGNLLSAVEKGGCPSGISLTEYDYAQNHYYEINISEYLPDISVAFYTMNGGASSVTNGEVTVSTDSQEEYDGAPMDAASDGEDESDTGKTSQSSGSDSPSGSGVKSTNYEDKVNYKNFCGNEGVSSAFRILGTIVYVLKIVAPLLIIATGVIDYFKAVTSSDEEALNKATQSLIRRIISGVLVFLIPGILWAILSLLDITDGMHDLKNGEFGACTRCLLKNECSGGSPGAAGGGSGSTGTNPT